ncbi:TetR/AcrR family transcriptional regulator [Holophaga foetida]|uniref:TetR/AcrR family transcriptional regulator n=1 Tax=Holophaga foetida TaxID=35839 RepID=UPI0002475369|nr:TetR/AcrR family transcriptional regulator [Holophaga foetida]
MEKAHPIPPQPVDDRTVEEKLLNAGLECLATLGGHKASVKQIAAMAGVNHGLVHYYFGSKEKLIVALFKRMADEQREALEQIKGPRDLQVMLARHALPNARLILEFNLLAREMPALKAVLREELKLLARLSADRMAKGDIRDGWLLSSAIVGLALHAPDMDEVDMVYMAGRIMEWMKRD